MTKCIVLMAVQHVLSGVIGIQGLAPYLFELDASLFVSQDGNVSGATRC